MDWVEHRNRNELRKLFHDHNISMLNYFAGERAIDLHWDQAVQIQNRYAKALIPWEKHGKQRFSRQRFNEMIELWESVWGKRDDPDTQKRIQWTADQLNMMAAQGGRNATAATR